MTHASQQFHWSVIGHEPQKRCIAAAITKGRLAQSFLFSGPPNCGKTTLAIDLARILMCAGEINAIKPCGQCAQCRTSLPVNPNYLLFDDDQPLRIEQVRRLQQFASMKSWSGGSTVAILANADRLTDEAAAALLKFLEEPAVNTVIILTTALPQILPHTIRSRLQHLRFGVANAEEVDRFCQQNQIADQVRQATGRLSGRLGVLKHLTINFEQYAQWEERATQLAALSDAPMYQRLQQSAELAEKETEEIVEVLRLWLALLAAELNKTSEVPHFLRLRRQLGALLQAIQQLRASMNKRISLDTLMLAFNQI